MEYNYPLFERVFNHYHKEGADFSNVKLHSCMHLLGPQAEMYKRFIQFGFDPRNITALGKIYSSNHEVVEELRGLGINVIQPEFDARSFDLVHAENCRNEANQIQDKDTNIILDDGGYLITEARSKNVGFAVEQTSSGFRKLENDMLNFPIFNVARSKTKLTQESPLIARQIVERTAAYIEDKGLTNPMFLIIGLGPIGSATYQILESQGEMVRGLDIETSREDLLKYLKTERPDVVIGATGSQLFTVEELESLNSEHTYHFISVSSSDREFPVCTLRNGQGPHEDVTYKNFVFVNNGFPITFKGLRNELTPVEIEKTIALLMGSVFHGILYGSDSNGFVDVPEELQYLINS